MARISWKQLFVRIDWLMILSVVMLFGFGIAAIYSVELGRESDFALVRRQLFVLLLGVGAGLAAMRFNYVQWRNYGRVLYLVSLVMMVAVLLFGTTLRGTTGWFVILGISFQPVELMKFALAVELARYFSERARRHFGWRELIGSGVLTAIPAILTAIQPDLGSAMLLVGIWLVVIFFAGLRFLHAAAMSVGGAVLGAIGWFFLFAEYQKERIRVFLDPTLDPLDSGYNVLQAKIAIGSGQWFGRGLGFGSQSQLKFLPESQTDFIFAVIAEELGFIGVMVLFFAMVLFLWRGLKLIQVSRDHFSTFLVVGILAAFFVQMSVNIAVNLAILPTTGIALPFVSYGGSSLLMSFFMLGVLLSVAVRQRPATLMHNNVL
jgi:rod shape determining protein RodA